MTQSSLRYSELTTPLGPLLLVANQHGLVAVNFQHGSEPLPIAEHWQRDDQALALARQQLTEYFAGQRQQFQLPLAANGTDFQQQVWTALTTIPYGVTASYGEVAKQIGRPKAVRALGAANGKNPLAVVVPCHRVIGANGSLTGYNGGLAIKQFLLALEQSHKPR
ncbi:methylated-DNA--[protein]-cysteine S-methyltransferase [Ferrimonas senticii]|uniref:methylated-DNA--[protein]-cysteine S-methyltransferase n=1 Tax=Ferrimonas senticii TaxID=394566 RepID=UPI0005500B0F|nr:methylated-DNA--[protein]-cysteine S-methyltransferase [Ferrimonas senticii]